MPKRAPRHLSLLAGALLAGLLAQLLWRQPTAPATVSPGPVAAQHPVLASPLGRRRAAGALLLPAAALAAPATASAKVGFQMRLPPTWKVFDRRGAPDFTESKPRTLLQAGDSRLKAEVRVVRAPLATSPRDPQALGGLALIEYFSSDRPRVTQAQAVEVLSKGFSSQEAIFSFNLLNGAADEMRNATKFLRYDFEAARCEGAQVKGVSGKICQRSDTGEILPTQAKRHTVLSTVLPEPVNGASVADGVLVGPTGVEVLWVVDISAPVENWANVTGAVQTLLGSFSVGTEEQLAAARAPAELAAVA